MALEPGTNGQPLTTAINWKTRADRGTDELIGLCRGILADGSIVREEAAFVLNWLNRNPPVRETSWGQQLHQLLVDVLSDEQWDANKECALVEMLLRFVGGTPTNDDEDALSYSSTLPLDNPEPTVTVEGRSFCFTGKFKCGTRTFCQNEVTRLGGIVHSNVCIDTNYLVIGSIGSQDWIHSSMGRKIEKAMQIRSSDGTPHIISEDLFIKST